MVLLALEKRKGGMHSRRRGLPVSGGWRVEPKAFLWRAAGMKTRPGEEERE